MNNLRDVNSLLIFVETKTKKMNTKEILNSRNEKGIIAFSNDAANWAAISRGGTHMITFYNTDENRFYKNEKSFAKRVCTLMKRGY